MVGTPELKKLLSCATVGRAKMVLVSDAYQLSPVRARGGMFEQMCAELPWSQRLGEVWRMRNTEERDASLALRSGHGNRLRKSVGWYRIHGRLHNGDPIAMAADARSWATRSIARDRSSPPANTSSISARNGSPGDTLFDTDVGFFLRLGWSSREPTSESFYTAGRTRPI
jgi:hypothetical protein